MLSEEYERTRTIISRTTTHMDTFVGFLYFVQSEDVQKATVNVALYPSIARHQLKSETADQNI